MSAKTFAIKYGRFNETLLRIFGMGPALSEVTVTDDHLHVHMGWGFDGDIPRSQIVSVEASKKPLFAGWGVHGWRGTWTVNGSSSGIVKITIEPPVHVRTIVFAIKLRVLYVSVDDPEGLISALNG